METSLGENCQVGVRAGDSYNTGEVSFPLQLCLQKADVKGTDQILR